MVILLSTFLFFFVANGDSGVDMFGHYKTIRTYRPNRVHNFDFKKKTGSFVQFVMYASSSSRKVIIN